MINATFGFVADSSISRSFLLPRALDPFCDDYLETVTRMSLTELMSMPQLNDTEFLDQLARGIDSVLGKRILISKGTTINDRIEKILFNNSYYNSCIS